MKPALYLQMMGGRLERSGDEVAELVAGRPAWMAGDPAGFSEEQLRLYKEHAAREAAAIEERMKRKAVMVRDVVMLGSIMCLLLSCYAHVCFAGCKAPESRKACLCVCTTIKHPTLSETLAKAMWLLLSLPATLLLAPAGD